MAKKAGGILLVTGLDTSKPAEYINAEASPNIQNMTVNRSIIKKRVGSSLLGGQAAGTDKAIMAIRQFIREEVYYVVRVAQDKIEEYNSSTDVWDDVTGVDLTGNDDDVMSTAIPLLSAQRVLAFTNFKDNVRKYTGTGNTADLGGSPPKCKYMVEFGSYLVLAYIDDGVAIRGARIQWCDTGDIETWTEGNSGAKDLIEDGEDIMGLGGFGNFITVHKSSSIYLGYIVTTSGIFRFDRKPTGRGTISNNTIQMLPTGDQAFLAIDGIRLFNGTSANLIISPVNDEIRESINLAEVHKCWSAVVPSLDEYWVGVPLGSDTIPSTIYRYNYKTKICLKDKRVNITAVGSYNTSTQPSWDDMTETWDSISSTLSWDDTSLTVLAPIVLLGDSSGYTYKRDTIVNNDNGVVIDGFIETKDYTILDLTNNSGDHGRQIQWGVDDAEPDRSMEVWAKGNSVVIDYSIDSGITWTNLGTLSLDSDYPADTSPDILYFDILNTKIRFRFRNNVLGETFTLKQFIVRAEERSLR